MPRTNPTPDPSFGVRVRELCTERHLSIAALARKSGLSPGVLRRILGGVRPVQPAERRCIARALRVKMQELAHREAVDPGLAAEVAARHALEQERDVLRAQVGGLREELSAERAARNAEVAELRAQQDLDDLRAEVDTLTREMAAERATHSAEVAELRDQHMRELAALRSSFHDEQVRALGEAQEREEKLTAALHIALDEIDRRSRTAPPYPPTRTGPASGEAVASPVIPQTASTGSTTPFAEKLTTLLVGLGGIAFGTWLLSPKQP